MGEESGDQKSEHSYGETVQVEPRREVVQTTNRDQFAGALGLSRSLGLGLGLYLGLGLGLMFSLGSRLRRSLSLGLSLTSGLGFSLGDHKKCDGRWQVWKLWGTAGAVCHSFLGGGATD